MSRATSKPLAVVTDDRFGSVDEERKVLEELGVELRVASCASSADVALACADADAILVNLAPIDAAAITAMPRLRVVSRYGIGMDNVDQVACASRGIAVANVPGYCDDEVAEHALGLLLAMTRGVAERDAAVRTGAWNVPTPQRAVSGSTVGVAGFGGAGRAFARAVLGLRPASLIVWSPTTTQARLDEALGPLASAFGVRLAAVSFDELLTESDFLSVHLRLEPSSAGIFGRGEFLRMKPGSFFVSTARGGLVDSAALAEVLRAGYLAGVGLDVLDTEPPPPDHPLLSSPRVVLTDHCAYRSTRSVSELKRRCAQNAARGLGLIT
ncbi:MAG: C-terminal binding protein [Spirochaetales bacterium]|nr:C-terminal binding protein [Spirochaetales bacterium]